MFNISNYLRKFKESIDDSESLKIKIIEIIKIKTNIDLKLEDIEVKNNKIIIKSNPGIKNKIFVYKKDLLNELNLISKVNFIDIG